MYPRKKVDDLISTRLTTMFTLIDKHLRSLGRRGPLPAGIIISGGGAGIGSISDIARGSLKLPARLAEFRLSSDAKIQDATWAVSYGLALWGLTGDTATAKKNFRMIVEKFLQQFLP
jgi:cell division protein FtsA